MKVLPCDESAVFLENTNGGGFVIGDVESLSAIVERDTSGSLEGARLTAFLAQLVQSSSLLVEHAYSSSLTISH